MDYLWSSFEAGTYWDRYDKALNLVLTATMSVEYLIHTGPRLVKIIGCYGSCLVKDDFRLIYTCKALSTLSHVRLRFEAGTNWVIFGKDLRISAMVPYLYEYSALEYISAKKTLVKAINSAHYAK